MVISNALSAENKEILSLYQFLAFLLCFWAISTSVFKLSLNFDETRHGWCKIWNISFTAFKSVRIWSFSGRYFPVFGLNSEIYFVNFKSPYSPRMREDTDQKSSKYIHFITQCFSLSIVSLRKFVAVNVISLTMFYWTAWSGWPL